MFVIVRQIVINVVVVVVVVIDELTERQRAGGTRTFHHSILNDTGN